MKLLTDHKGRCRNSGIALLLLFVPVLCFAEEPEKLDWDMGMMQKEIVDLKVRVGILEANWDMGRTAKSAACPCPEGGSCICPADNCPCEDCPEHLSNQRVIEIYAANEKEISKIWEDEVKAGREETTMRKAVQIWLKRQSGKPKAKSVTGRTALGFGATWCPPCVGVKKDSEGLSLRWYDVDEDKAVADRYHVSSLPALILLENGNVVTHHTGATGFVNKAERWLDGKASRAGEQAGVRVGGVPREKTATLTPASQGVQKTRVVSPPVVKAKSFPTYTQNRGPGHTHRCGRCGTSWSHENWNVGNPAAHRCPGCGNLEYGNRTEGWGASRPVRTRTMPAANFFQPRVMFSAGGSFCPTCPR